ncbi:MAG: hypothetical protein HQL94_04015 [Magnetococcales bacterium]|nr:hypothetical protein [Magnetococcales bacterium]MBF0439675.1 hypothetical protein [Magnetococcales bacterium]
MNITNSLMNGVNNMNNTRAQLASKQIVQNVQSVSASTLQTLNQQNSVSNHMVTKAFSVNFSLIALQKNAAQSS